MSKIEWTDETWNPVTGCTKISPGCANCYAEGVSKRFWGKRKFTDVQCFPHLLVKPLRKRVPKRIFVCSMSDLFHDDVELDFIAAVFAVMAASPKMTFQVLTKRPERMKFFMEWIDEMARIAKDTFPDDSKEWRRAQCLKGFALKYGTDVGNPTAIAERPWPLSNVWKGVSVENQTTADERTRMLLQVPAATRFISYEPALEEVDLAPVLNGWCPYCGGDNGDGPYEFSAETHGKLKCNCCHRTWHHGGLRSYEDSYGDTLYRQGIDWVIVGGESGPGARPCNVEWIKSTVKQCKTAGVPCFVKQVGAKPCGHAQWEHEANDGRGIDPELTPLVSSKGGDPDEWPKGIRVRQFPKVKK
jgi:protein gp37